MKAVRMHAEGGPEVLSFEEIEEPRAGADEIVVQVHAASVNPVDFKIRAGAAPFHPEMPTVLGRDVAGTVVRVGEAVTEFKQGDEVFATVPGGGGGYAEQVAVKAAEAARKPRECSFVEAAAVPLAALTAWQGLFDQGGLRAGETVLIHGAGGGVGHFAVQLAKHAGATVIATASAEDREMLAGFGVDQIIDHETENFERRVSEVDLVFDLVAGETRERSWAVLRRGGALVSTLGQPSEDKAAEHGVRAVGYMVHGDGGQLSEIAGLIDDGTLCPIVQATYPLVEAGRAQRRLEETHTRGKIVLEVTA